VASVAAVLLPVGNTAWGANNVAIRLLTTIPIPVTAVNNTAGAMYSFDISWVDQGTHTYYLADRSNRVVDIVDTKTNTFLGQLAATPPFAGFTPCVGPGHGANDCAGPNGVVTGGHCLFVTDAPSRVVSFNTTSFPPTQVSNVQTHPTDPTRADELAFDPTDNIILAINNASTPPFGTFIKVNPTNCVLTPPTAADRIPFNAAGGVDATNGAEQPQWDPDTGRFYLSIPEIGPNVKNGGVVRINPTTHAIDGTFPISFCSPAGLSKGPNHDFLVGCNTVFDIAGNVWDPAGAVTAAPILVILDVSTGTVTQVLGVGAGDEVWFNPGDGNYYATGSGSPLRPLPAATAMGSTPLGVIDAEDRSLIQLVPTYNVPAGTGHPAATAHSVAADASNNQIYVPLGANTAFPDCLTGCIAVFFRPSLIQPFAGTPGQSNCHGVSVSALAGKYGGLNAAAAALGFAQVQGLQDSIRAFCGS
jgi:hypothetical protein